MENRIKEAPIAKTRNTYAKRQREQDKKQRADRKREKRDQRKKTGPPLAAPEEQPVTEQQSP
jgi:hypothetical protein